MIIDTDKLRKKIDGHEGREMEKIDKRYPDTDALPESQHRAAMKAYNRLEEIGEKRDKLIVAMEALAREFDAIIQEQSS